MDGDEDSPTDLNSTPSVKVPPEKTVRHRCYPDTAKGPYEVFIRQKEKPINVLLVSAELHKHFKTVKEIKKISFGKVRVLFANRQEANDVVFNELLSRLYRVYVPSDRVEIDGVVNQADLDLNHVVKNGQGKFKDPRLPTVSILECNRLVSAVSSEGKTNFVQTHEVRITFVGSSLPDYLFVDNVLIPVRFFSPKLMRCQKCKRFGHTEQFCANKARCGKCGQSHPDGQCTIVENVCLLCKGTHASEKDCPAYRERMRFARARVIQKSKLSYAEMLRQAVPSDFNSDNPYSSLSELSDIDEEVPHNSQSATPKRKKISFSKRVKKSKPSSPDAQFNSADFPSLIPTVSASQSTVPSTSAKVPRAPGFPQQQERKNEVPTPGKLTITGLIQLISGLFNPLPAKL